MNGVNKVFLMGRLGLSPELHFTKGGKPYTRLQLATHKAWRNGEGRMEAKTQWHSVFVFGRTAEVCHQHLTKGSAVMVEGSLSKFEVPSESGQRWMTSITADQVEFLPIRARTQELGEPPFDSASSQEPENTEESQEDRSQSQREGDRADSAN